MAEIRVVKSYRYYDGWNYEPVWGGVTGNAGKGYGHNFVVVAELEITGFTSLLN